MPEFVRVEGMANWPLIAQALKNESNDQYAIAKAMLDLTQKLLAKNHDYGSSVFKQPILAKHLSVADAQRVRMSDKIERLISLLDKPALVDDESTSDTLMDLGGYCILAAIWRDRQDPVRESER